MDHDAMPTKAPSLRAYWDCLRDNESYKWLWLADFTDYIGSWLSYVATLEIISEFSDGSGLALSAIILIRMLPSLVLSPLAGVVADRCNRVTVLIVAALFDAVFALLLILIQHPSQTPLLFLLLGLQFSAIAIQDPARRAIVPVVVPESQLHLATTLETFSWSLTGAVGAATGGAIASYLGNSACFAIDACTYFLAAYLASKVPRALGDPLAMAVRQKDIQRAKENVEARGASKMKLSPPPVLSKEGDVEMAETNIIRSSMDGTASVLHRHATAPSDPTQVEETTALLTTHDITPSKEAPKNSSLTADVLLAAREGIAAAKEGFVYLLAVENRDVAALVFMKGCGSATWGAIDVLNVKYSELEYMQLISGDAPTTLGIIFATVGLGCFLGPMALNTVVAPHPKPLLWASAAAFVFLFLGSVLMAAGSSLIIILLATLVRSCGSATLWIYSTLLLQLRCPNAILGRVSATEMAIYVVAEACSSVYGGAAFDLLKLSLRATTTSIAVVTGLFAGWWVWYAWRHAETWEAASKERT